MLATLKHWLEIYLRSLFMVAITFFQFVSFVSAKEQTPVFPRLRLDAIGLVIHSLEQRSPADNTSFGAGIDRVALSGDRQAYYTVINVGGINFRVALDTASADLWLISSACLTDSCKKVPPYPLTYNSTTFVSFRDNTTRFAAHYSDDTSASGFVARETVQVANLTLANQTFGLVENTNVSFTDMTSGILGLSFPRLSSFSSGIDDPLPFFSNLVAQSLLEYPLFALSLTRNSSGTLTLGAVDGSVVKDPALISWIQVAEFPPFGEESRDSSYLEWAVPITGFTANYTSFTPIPTYNAIQRPTLALFDIGAPGIYGSYQDVSRLFGAIDGARLVDQYQWAVPCETSIPISFTFGTKNFTLLPTDYLRGPASGNPNMCLTWPIAYPPSSDGIDWQLGSAFLRTVYSIFSFGIDKKEPPMIGLYPLRNDTNITAQTQSPSEILSYLSDNSATITTTLPNYLLPTPTFTTPPYTFNTSVTAMVGRIVSSGLANNTYSPLFGPKTVLENSSALPTILPPPSVVTLTVTESGHVSTITKTYPIPSITLGLPSSSGSPIWSHNSVLEAAVAVLGLHVILWTISFS